MVGASQRRSAVRYLRRRYSVSERRGCAVTGTSRSTYRYPSKRPSGDALAITYQNSRGLWRRMCPDFLFFHGDSEQTKVSIVDPHGHHLADALPKLRGLAAFAAKHGAFFHRIESVARMPDGTLRVLDFMDSFTRKAIAEADDAQALYRSDQATDY